MNPVQLAKLNGPKTEVADTPTFNLVSEVLTRPDYGGVPAEMEETVEEVEMPRIDGPLNNVVCKSTGPNEYTYEGPIEEIVELNTRINEEAEEVKPHASLPRTKKKKRRR